MFRKAVRFTIVLCATTVFLAIANQPDADAQSKTAVSKPAASKPSATSAASTQPAISPKAMAFDPQDAIEFRKQAEEWAAEGKKIIPNLHLLETDHFLIYSSWSAKEDAGMKQLIERMYSYMCKQFDVSVKDQYWVGKLPIYAIGDNEHYAKFSAQVMKAQINPKVNPGYCMSMSNGFACIVMDKCDTLAYFAELLSHEASHAFIARYISNVHIPTWVNEGIAEYMAATVPQGVKTIAGKRYRDATRDAISNKKSIAYIFDGWTGESFDYGIGQSLVRYLAARDQNGFSKFLILLKEKKSQEDALQETFKLTQEQLIADWTKACAKVK